MSTTLADKAREYLVEHYARDIKHAEVYRALSDGEAFQKMAHSDYPGGMTQFRKDNGWHLVDKIMAYEAGEMTMREILQFFGGLIESGLVWSLQGSYGRTANSFIHDGYLTTEGYLTEKAKTSLGDFE